MKPKSRLFLLALLLVLTLLPLGSASASDEIRYVVTGNHKSLNMRADMSTDSTVITTIPYGAQVHLIGICDNASWASVYYGDYNGYVMVRYLSTKKPSESGTSTDSQSINYKSFTDADYYVTVTPSTPTGFVNLRWAPSKEAAVQGIYYQGEYLRVIAENGSWAQVLDESTLTCGFMLKNFLY
ncbi:MAG: SH3 domain-containing protein [Eubacteriales bacterium]|nr:SH3 domain-containing protein [Eubacteriales bacterium]